MFSVPIDDRFRYDFPRRWIQPAAVVLIAVIGIFALFYPSFRSMASIWWNSDTFSYGFVILPISAWLVWEKRGQLTALEPHPEYRVLWLSLLAGCVWLFARLLGLPVVEQFAAISILISTVWGLLGTAVFKTLIFPLGFLFFAVPLVPLHDAIVLPMIDFTADFTVTMIRLTGVPVLREGSYISLPSGDWEVTRACAGIRYMVASVVLGCVFAYLTYRSLWRRLLFIAFSLVLPILANGLRAYLIAMLGHLSNMKLAVGVDHFIYGWVFFGLTMIFMFLLGSIWRQPRYEVPVDSPAEIGSSGNYSRSFVTACLTSLLIAAIWPVAATAIKQVQVDDNQVNLKIPVGAGGWQIDKDWLWAWWPRVQRIDGEFYKFYRKGDQAVSLYVGQFRSQREGVELIDAENVLVERGFGPEWIRHRPTVHHSVDIAGRALEIVQSEVTTIRTTTPRPVRLLVWRWYRLGDRYPSNNPYLVKWLDVWSRVSGGRRDAGLIVMAAPYEKDIEEGERLLRSFAESMLPEVEKVLDASVGVE